MRVGRLGFIAAVVLLGGAPVGAPQGGMGIPQLAQPLQPEQASSTPTLKVYSRETVVDVTVTDAKGNPVHGLKQEDFTVKEDGKPQIIKSFNEYGPNDSADSYVQPNLPPNTYTNRQPPPAGSAINLLLLDGLNTAPPDGTDGVQIGWSFAIQKRVKQGAAKFLSDMPLGTQVAVLGLSRNLRILQGITSDPALLSAAVDTMEMNIDGRATTVREWCNQQNMRNRATLEALNQLAADVGDIKGKKNLIWFSAGFPTITDSRVNHDAGGNGCLPDYTQDLLKTYGLLAAAQIAVSPIGARIFGSFIANPVNPGIVPPGSPSYLEFTADEQGSFESMAEATGGTAYYNTNDLAGAIAKAVDKGANYYTISYVPPGKKYDYGHHTIKIEAAQPGLHLLYRQTYDAVDPATIKPPVGLTLATALPAAGPGSPAIDMRMAMGRSMPVSTQLIFNVHVEPSPMPASAAGASPPAILGTLDPAVKAKLKGKPLTRYGFLYSIPTRQIVFADAPDGGHTGSLELDLAVYDGDGKLVTGLSQTLKMPMSDARYKQFLQAPYSFFQQIDLPPGALFVRIGVLDPTANKVGTLELPLTVPKS